MLRVLLRASTPLLLLCSLSLLHSCYHSVHGSGAGTPPSEQACLFANVPYTREDVYSIPLQHGHHWLDLFYPRSSVRLPPGSTDCGPDSAWARERRALRDEKIALDLEFDPTEGNVFLNEAKALPLIVLWHAGGWLDRSKNQYVHVGHTWAEQLNAVVAIPNYPLTIRKASEPDRYYHPLHVQGAALALKWLLEQEGFPYDPNHIYVGGHCAGGTMAGQLLLGPYLRDLDIDPFRVLRGCYSFEGIFDVARLSADYANYAAWFLNMVFGDPSKWDDASPQHMNDISGMQTCNHPSWLMSHSQEDPDVNLPQSKRFVEHLQRLGFCDILEDYGDYGNHMHGSESVASSNDHWTPIMGQWLRATMDHDRKNSNENHVDAIVQLQESDNDQVFDSKSAKVDIE